MPPGLCNLGVKLGTGDHLQAKCILQMTQCAAATGSVSGEVQVGPCSNGRIANR